MISFLPLIAKQQGFSGFLTGQMFTILPISGLVAKPLFGGLADKFKLHKKFFIIFQVILTIAFLTINFIPGVPIEKPSAMANFICNDFAFLQICSPRIFSNQESLVSQNLKKNFASCNLSCSIESMETIQVLCNSWKVDKYCKLSEVIKPNEIKYLEKLEFEAQFNQSYDLIVSNFGFQLIFLNLLNNFLV